VPQSECSGEFDRFTPGVRCELLDPPCEPMLGACCAQGECVANIDRFLCEKQFGGTWFIGEECAEQGGFQCPLPACEWDNGSGEEFMPRREASPPGFPTRRVVDDVFFQDPCTIDRLHVDVVEDNGWESGSTMTVFLYSDGDGFPFELLNEVTGPFTRIALGQDYTGRSMFQYRIENLGIDVGSSSSRFIGFRNDEGSGDGTNYWMGSDGGIDGGNSGDPFFSDDDGDTWNRDSEIQRAFRIVGNP
jgi:hypothetical protein